MRQNAGDLRIILLPPIDFECQQSVCNTDNDHCFEKTYCIFKLQILNLQLC